MQDEFQDVPVYFWNRITLREKAVFYEHLSNLLDGGVTLIEALRSFVEKTTNPLLYREVAQLLLLIDSGDVMSIAMKKLPRTFEIAEVSIVEAGEQSGTMQKSFGTLAEDLRNRQELTQKLKGALAYPVIILSFLIAAILIVMVFVIPKLLPLFETANTTLPASTRSLIATSNFISDHFLFLIFLAIFVGLMIFGYLKTVSGKRNFDEWLIWLPLVGTVYRNYVIVRVSTTLGLLLGAGIPILKTLRLSGASTGNSLYEEVFAEIVRQVEQGNKIADSFGIVDPKGRYFTRDFIQLLAAGEKTSTINKVCGKISVQYTREVDNSVTTLVKFVEPLAILISGVFVVWFAFAIFSAVLKITETVN
jgi:type II secretory pathway component PulF